ncbi:MAG: SUMF1/EgtB/PvdO family nonheme iron enzyme [bacterium]|nr:SUMF1/EgtB/PvdO family nonheme iron enzyme [bacterium]
MPAKRIIAILAIAAAMLIQGCSSSDAPKASVSQSDGRLTLTLPGDVTMEFIRIEPGTFLMGSPPSEKDRDDIEGPQHKVTLTRPFYMSATEVTQGQWTALIKSNPSKFQGDPALPVEQVTWELAQAFIEKMNQLGAGVYRLPTEAEWEYACRAGTSTRYFWGDDLYYTDMAPYAWYDTVSDWSTHPAGMKKPNAWGLYDMAGNVSEWCSDVYAPYPAEAQTGPTGPAEGGVHVRRGGSYYNFGWDCRCASRNVQSPPPGQLSILGLRLVREAE